MIRPHRAKGVVLKWPPNGFQAVAVLCPCRFNGKVYIRTAAVPDLNVPSGTPAVPIHCPGPGCSRKHKILST